MNVGDKVRVKFIPGVIEPKEIFADSYTITSKESEEDGTYSYYLDGNLHAYIFSEESVEPIGEVIKVMYHTNRIDRLGAIDKGDWIDMRCAEDIEMKKGDFKLIPLGVSMKLPDGYEAHLVPRSSTYMKFGLIQANHMGIIDSSYCGDTDEWKFPAIAVRDTVIHANDRICQFRIQKVQPQIIFEEIDHLSADSRGGFGSTGVQ